MTEIVVQICNPFLSLSFGQSGVLPSDDPSVSEGEKTHVGVEFQFVVTIGVRSLTQQMSKDSIRARRHQEELVGPLIVARRRNARSMPLIEHQDV